MSLPLARRFKIRFDPHTLIGDVMAHDDAPQLLLLHGAGHSNRERFQLLRAHFWEHGISSAAFDFVGHGDTGGELRSSSLRSRTEQACRVIKALHLSPPLSILAASMGAYTAVTLLRHYAIGCLILVMPAMYTAEAYDVPFNRGFTEVIRRTNSWQQSDAWHLLSGYTGELLVIAGENDAVIPPDVIRNIYEAAKLAKRRDLYVIPGASHNAITDLRANDPVGLEHVLGLMTSMLRT